MLNDLRNKLTWFRTKKNDVQRTHESKNNLKYNQKKKCYKKNQIKIRIEIKENIIIIYIQI